MNHSAQAEFAERLSRLQATRQAEAEAARAAKKDAGAKGTGPRKAKGDSSLPWLLGFVLVGGLGVGGAFLITRAPAEPGAEAPGLVASVMGMFGAGEPAEATEDLAAIEPVAADSGAEATPKRLVLDSNKSD